MQNLGIFNLGLKKIKPQVITETLAKAGLGNSVRIGPKQFDIVSDLSNFRAYTRKTYHDKEKIFVDLKRGIGIRPEDKNNFMIYVVGDGRVYTKNIDPVNGSSIDIIEQAGEQCSTASNGTGRALNFDNQNQMERIEKFNLHKSVKNLMAVLFRSCNK